MLTTASSTSHFLPIEVELGCVAGKWSLPATRTHIALVLKNLQWLPVAAWAQFKVLTLTYKALNGLGPGYLKDCLFPYEPAHLLRSDQEALLKVPSLKEVRGMACQNRAFEMLPPNFGMPSLERSAWLRHSWLFGARQRPFCLSLIHI